MEGEKDKFSINLVTMEKSKKMVTDLRNVVLRCVLEERTNRSLLSKAYLEAGLEKEFKLAPLLLRMVSLSFFLQTFDTEFHEAFVNFIHEGDFFLS